MSTFRRATEADLEAYEANNYVSKIPCVLCGELLHVKDITGRDKALCYKHEYLRPNMARQNWFKGTDRTKEERLAIVRGDKTRRVGPFFKMKQV